MSHFLFQCARFRYYRRYWSINCIPGIFVEEFQDENFDNDFLQVKVAQIKSEHSNGSGPNSQSFAQSIHSQSMTNGDTVINGVNQNESFKAVPISLADCESYVRKQGKENRYGILFCTLKLYVQPSNYSNSCWVAIVVFYLK